MGALDDIFKEPIEADDLLGDTLLDDTDDERSICRVKDDSGHEHGDDGKFSGSGGSGGSKGDKNKSSHAAHVKTLKERFSSVGHNIKDIEHVAAAYVSSGVKSCVSKLPSSMQPKVEKAWAATKLCTKTAFISYTAGQALAAKVAKATGASEESAQRLRGICTALDLVGAKAVPLTLTALGVDHGSAFAASFLPVGSTAYLAYSTARHPAETFKAAQEAIKSIIQKKGRSMRSEHDNQAELTELLQRIQASSDPDQYHALVCAALEHVQTLAEAMDIADEAMKKE